MDKIISSAYIKVFSLVVFTSNAALCCGVSNRNSLLQFVRLNSCVGRQEAL